MDHTEARGYEGMRGWLTPTIIRDPWTWGLFDCSILLR